MSLGEHQPGDEYWKGDLPMIVFLNRMNATASLEFTYADGRHLSVPISFQTAEGLVKDLDLKLEEKA